jgi:hypothetical protein
MRKDFGPLPLPEAGEFRHCHPGQESNLVALLAKKGMTLEHFNRVWDDIARKSNSSYRATPRSIPRSQWPEGHLANVAVYPSAPAAYAKMMAIRDSGVVPACSQECTMWECTRLDADGTLWVPLAWLTMIGLKVSCAQDVGARKDGVKT